MSPAAAVSQMHAVLSHDAVTMRDPFGLKAAQFTAASCPRRTEMSLATVASQIRAVLSYEAVTIRLPSGLKAAYATPRGAMRLLAAKSFDVERYFHGLLPVLPAVGEGRAQLEGYLHRLVGL